MQIYNARCSFKHLVMQKILQGVPCLKSVTLFLNSWYLFENNKEVNARCSFKNLLMQKIRQGFKMQDVAITQLVRSLVKRCDIVSEQLAMAYKQY